MEEPQSRSLFGPLEKLMLIIGLGILAYVGFQKGGFSIMEKEETVTILDKPNGPDRKARKYKDVRNEESVEALLQDLAEQFSEKESPRIIEKKTPTSKLPKDEEKFYKSVRNQETFGDKLQSAKDWYQVLSASQKTYSKVKEILGEVSRQPEEKVNANNVEEQLDNQNVQADFYQKLSESFEIDQADVEAFGRKGAKALSDWAEFVQQKSKN